MVHAPRPSNENTAVGMPVQIHNYDVLLMPSAKHEPIRFAPGKVGNRRFRVLLDLFRQRYLEAAMLGDEYDCDNVAREVLGVVCDKCIPNGRFFQLCHDGRWKQYKRNSHATVVMVRRALKNDPIEESPKETTSKQVSGRSTSELFGLLCKAASKTLPTPGEFVASPKPFDVICEANGLGISQDHQHTGNNRLKVMFGIRMEDYKKTNDKEGKLRIAEEIVSSIVDDASGHFLREDKIRGRYMTISRESAATCIKSAFDEATVAVGENQQFRDAEVKKLVRRRHKKTVMDRLENRHGSNGGKALFSNSSPPTTFYALKRRNQFASTAA